MVSRPRAGLVGGDDRRRHDVEPVVGEERQQPAREQVALERADRGGGQRLPRLAVVDELDRPEDAAAADLADDGRAGAASRSGAGR